MCPVWKDARHTANLDWVSLPLERALEVSCLQFLFWFDSVSVIGVTKGAEDADTMERSKREDRVIVTDDKDFGWSAVVYKRARVITSVTPILHSLLGSLYVDIPSVIIGDHLR